jgi:predicted chitinase
MRRILLFVLAIAIVKAATTTGFGSYSDSSAVQASTASSTISTVQPIAQAATATSENPYFLLLAQMTVQDSQKDNAKIIFEELHATLNALNLPANLNLAKYLAATAFTDSNLVPSEEKYDAKLANIQKGYFTDGFMGRGYVHFTGAFNYQRFSNYLKLDLISEPTLLLQPRNAAKALVYGSVFGKFTGTKISQFFPLNGAADLTGARKAVNGDFRAKDVELTFKSLFGTQ